MTLIRTEALDLFCGLVAIFIVLILDSMVAVKHHDDIVRRLKIQHAEIRKEELSLAKRLDGLKQGLKASIQSLKKANESLLRRGQTVMRLQRVIANCKNWDSTGWGVASRRNGDGRWYKVLVRVDSQGNRTSGWKYWCFSAGYEHKHSKSAQSGQANPIPKRLQARLKKLLEQSGQL